LSEQALHLREVNQTLQDSEQRLRLAIETGKIGLWIWNSTGVKNSGSFIRETGPSETIHFFAVEAVFQF
jgi:PAS domain-containing protein